VKLKFLEEKFLSNMDSLETSLRGHNLVVSPSFGADDANVIIEI
jgi:hypothetical protein